MNVRDTELLFTERRDRSLGEVRGVGAYFMFLNIRVGEDTIFARDLGEHADVIGHALEVCLAQATVRLLTSGLLLNNRDLSDVAALHGLTFAGTATIRNNRTLSTADAGTLVAEIDQVGTTTV